MPSRYLMALCVALLGSACVRVDHTSVRHETAGIPDPVFGEWSGGWSSTGAAGSGMGAGSVQLRVQAFDGQPLLSFVVDNPCLQPVAYSFSLQGRHLEITSVSGNDMIVFAADLDDSLRQLHGTYECMLDAGTWSADWSRPLLPIGDLSGTWYGSFESTFPAGAGTLSLELQQFVADGALQVTGTLNLVDHALTLPVRSGLVDWTDGHFSLDLVTDPQVLPLIHLQGDGDGQSLTIPNGEFVVATGSAVAATGLWFATWVGH
jgi:hypothetical protein